MRRNVMMRAHQIAKGLEGDYRARMSLALRQAWKEEKEEKGEMGNSVKWTSEKGNVFEVKVDITREVQDKTVDADGQTINLGKETYESMMIKLYKDGELIEESRYAPSKITRTHYRDYDKIVAAGAYARFGDKFVNKTIYDKIMEAIELANNSTTVSEEYKAVKSAEIAKQEVEDKALDKEAARYAEQVKNGLCPKCGTWCYGDCEAN